MTPWRIFGLSGQVGEALLAARLPDDPVLSAISRQPLEAAPGVVWSQGSLETAEPEAAVSAVVSLGPLDAFARWYARSGAEGVRVVALGSTSVHSKATSPDAAERALAADLAEAEATLTDACASRGCALTLLRPTLIYGNGRDRNLSRLVGVARRWGGLPLPLSAGGLRQPIHVADVAGAVLAALRSASPVPGAFDLPGGETLGFDTMVRRTLAVAAPSARVLRLPGPVFRGGVRLMRVAGRLDGAGEGVLARLHQDLCFDGTPARIALSHAPRGFQPTREMFPG